MPLSGPQLMLLVSPGHSVASIQAAIRGGITLIELRAKNVSTAEFLEAGRGIQSICAGAGIPLIVNDRPDVCLALGARGVHVGSDDLPPLQARNILGPDRILGVSARTMDRLALAEAAGADYLGVGALRTTTSKLDTKVIGLEGIEAMSRSTALPVLAIGGVLPEDVPELLKAGAIGVAVSGGVLGDPDPERAARTYRKALDGA